MATSTYTYVGTMGTSSMEKYIRAITMTSRWEILRQFEGIEKAPKKKAPLQRGSSLLH
jgi:hypothetical protein